ncbi:ABC transporter permease [Hespellia stercorisuis]|uniref:Putative ABC transport system permease protein n=1 Tax=Hespellia stercorisuis DSM 15480 TaxID=1121950 RepID=A0A1M6UJ52_9FIRM|nr:ABC transporter permease [Hespellia stercorisuis]SHK69207.1 putative ABC transport system permease protein [Hespellia stercorisuis DSM 15480]
MLKNNNEQVIDRMVKRSFLRNKRKNMVLILAVFLAAFMIFSVFTVGVTYLQMLNRQNIRMNGAKFDAVLMGGYTEAQKEICEEEKDITIIGSEAKAAYAEKTDRDDTLNTAIIWSDETYWNKMKPEAVAWVRGNYPQKENEIMVTKAALKDCGYEELEIGDELPLTCRNHRGTYTKTFTITGMWEGYGTQKVIYVSKAFYDQSGYRLEDTNSGILYVDFKSVIVSAEKQAELEDRLNLGKQQRIFFNGELEMSVNILFGMLGLITVTCFSAYLLIYNILQMSVAANVRYFGLLQTIGMTEVQIRKMLKKQVLLTGIIGMAGGLCSGSIASFVLIPGIVKILGIRENVQVVFQPLVFLLTVVLVMLTLILSSRRPAKYAASVSPIEALGFRGISRTKTSHRTGRGDLLWRMAAEHLKKDKKKTVVVLLSLAASLSVFLCLVTLIESQGARTIVSNHENVDLVVKNDTTKKENEAEWIPILDKKFLDKLQNNKKIRETHPMTMTSILVPWEPDFADSWMREFYETWMDHDYAEDIAEYKAHPEKFHSFMTGIDEKQFDDLNSTLQEPIDKESFLKGDICILYRHGLSFDEKDLDGKVMRFSLQGQPDEPFEMKIAGLTESNYYVNSLGMAANIIVSDRFVNEHVENPMVFQTGVVYEEMYDEQTEAEVKQYVEDTSYAKDVSYNSKIEMAKSIKKMQGNMMGVGIGIILVLSFIGIMNYINTVYGNIQSRQVEISIMESVGMSEKQVKEMLIRCNSYNYLLLIFLFSSKLQKGTG